MSPGATALLSCTTASSLAECAKETAVNRVMGAVERDVPDETDEAFKDLAEEHEDECHVDYADNEEDGERNPGAGRVSNRDLQHE